MYDSLYEMFMNRGTKFGEIGVYFIGELHDKDGFIHWNLYAIDRTKKEPVLRFFEPATSLECPHGYDFKSREQILLTYKQIYHNEKQESWTSVKRPQYICLSGTIGVDRFCQTWCLCFLDMLCNGVEKQFLNLDFQKYQTAVVKYWLLCFLTKHGFDKDKSLKDNVDFKIFRLCINVKEETDDYNIMTFIEIPGKELKKTVCSINTVDYFTL